MRLSGFKSALFGVCLIAGAYYAFEPFTPLRLAVVVMLFIVSFPLVGFFMRRLVDRVFAPLVRHLDGADPTGTGVGALALVSCLLRGPWILAAASCLVWLLLAPPIILAAENLTYGPHHNPSSVVAVIVALLPALFIINVMRVELLLKSHAPQVQLDQAPISSYLSLSINKKLIFALFLLGPYLVGAALVTGYLRVATSADTQAALIGLRNLAIFFGASASICTFISAQYIARVVNQPLRRITEALKTGSMEHSSGLLLDEFGDVASLIRERTRIEQAKQAFVAMVSHDLRSPLMGLQGFCQLLSKGAYGPLPSAVQNKARAAATNAGRLIKLVNDILDAEKLEAGLFDCVKAPTSTEVIVTRAVDSVGYLAEQNGVQIEITGEPCDLNADEERLVQVLVNLLANAIRYADGKPITIETIRCDELVEIAVIDSGKGIAEEDQSHIFERFRQAQNCIGGTGLGLPIAKALVDLHGGQIGVTSKVGQGSRFWFRIPVVQHAPTEPAAYSLGTNR